MKKLLSIFLVLGVLTLLSGCKLSFSVGEKEFSIGSDDVKTDDVKADDVKVDDVKVDDVKVDDVKVDDVKVDDVKVDDVKVDDVKVDDVKDEPKPYTGANYITVDSPKNEATITETPIIFKGVVSPNTKKVVATASYGNKECTDNADGPCIQYHEDVYTLLDFKLGDESFTYRAKEDFNNLSPYGSNNFEFKAYFDDGTSKTTSLTIYYNNGVAEMGKPVIYLYPKDAMKIFVDVDPAGGISVSEPALEDGWNVLATPDGKILNLADLKVYPYLFYEGYAYNFETPEEGFVVEKENVAKFFDEKLAVLGLNEKEIADFKEFWVPKFTDDPYYFITFIPQQEFDEYAPLTVSPSPDSIIRVFFDYKGLSEKIEVAEQELQTPTRSGFALVEWGGRLYR